MPTHPKSGVTGGAKAAEMEVVAAPETKDSMNVTSGAFQVMIPTPKQPTDLQLLNTLFRLLGDTEKRIIEIKNFLNRHSHLINMVYPAKFSPIKFPNGFEIGCVNCRPITFAIAQGDSELVKLLLNCGADYSLEIKDGNSPRMDILRETLNNLMEPTEAKKIFDLLCAPIQAQSFSVSSSSAVVPPQQQSFVPPPSYSLPSMWQPFPSPPLYNPFYTDQRYLPLATNSLLMAPPFLPSSSSSSAVSNLPPLASSNFSPSFFSNNNGNFNTSGSFTTGVPSSTPKSYI